MRDEYDFSKGKLSPYSERVKPGVKARAHEIVRLLDELEQEAESIDEEGMEEVRRAWPAPGLEAGC